MSKLPLIHSISTVGVVKHYNQDYLIHDTRTDFTGPNGIGKSLLADLLQILFIAEKKKIHFGTDSVKKEHRQIHTIPYKTPHAYFFLNIEVESQMYLTFGVNIPNSSSSPIKLFRILNHHFDAEKDSKKTKKARQNLQENLIPEEKLPYFKDFIVDKTIPSVEILTKHLRDEKELYIDFFTKKAERNELYQFFFDKNILPLNLSQESHLNSFAKVLQAFSKANTLDTDKDESLKTFLFENKKNEIENEYKHNKQNLDDYVDRYKNLNELIDALTSKRLYLENLEELQINYNEVEKEYNLHSFYDKKNMLSEKLKSWSTTKTTIDNLKSEIGKLEKTIPNLETREKKDSTKFKSYSTGLTNLNTYQNNYSKYLSKVEELQSLNKYDLPSITNEEVGNFEFDDITIKEILQHLDSVSKVLKTYKTISGIELQFRTQKGRLDVLTKELELKKGNLKKLLKILELDNKSFASQLIKKKTSISLGQETILRSFLLDTKWEFPDEILDGVMYTSSFDILDEKNIEEDKVNKGFWYTLGDIRRFISYLSSDRLFNDKKALANAFSVKRQSVTDSINELAIKLDQLKQIEEGSSEDIQTLNFGFKWDNDIPDQRKVTEFSSHVRMIQNLDTYKTKLQQSINAEKKKLDDLSDNIPFKFSNENIEGEITKCSNELTKLNELQLGSSRVLVKSKTLLSVKQEELRKIDYDPQEVEQSKKEEKNKIDEEKKRILIKFPKLEKKLEIKKPESLDLNSLRTTLALNKTNFELLYKNALDKYKELGDDIEVRDEIENETFVFKILEKKLLGNNIIETKNIENALNSIYKDRNKLANTIINTMLKIFHKTQDEYDNYKSIVARLNNFFKGELVSKKYYFQVEFKTNENFKVSWINNLSSSAQSVGLNDSLFKSETVEQFVEDSFKRISGYTKGIDFSDLLDPKTYFTLKTEFKDSEGKPYPGSTGESYTARVLLGIGRLSITSKEKRQGVRFLILEEVSNLDDENFNTFPEIAKKYDYQIITMTPEPFGSNSEDGWYLHQLIEGKTNKDINYPIPSSSFKTNYQNEQLKGYLKRHQSK